MKLTYSGSDKYGSYQLRYENKILYSIVKGAVGLSLAKKFHLDLYDIFTTITDKQWAYIADLSGCQAYTEEVEEHLPLVHRQATESGCVIDAYLIGTALLKAQLTKIRINSGITLDLNDCTFENIPQCEEFVRAVLTKMAITAD